MVSQTIQKNLSNLQNGKNLAKKLGYYSLNNFNKAI